MLKTPAVFLFIRLICPPTAVRMKVFRGAGTGERSTFFRRQFAGGFNFRAIVDYVRRDLRHTRAARLHQRRSPGFTLSRVRFFNPYSIIFAESTAPRFQYLRDQLLHNDALLHSVKNKKELFRRTGLDPVFRLHGSLIALCLHIYIYFFVFTDHSIFLS